MQLPALAVCGSNVAGGVPFSVAVRTAQATLVLSSADGERGDLAALSQQVLARAGVAARELRTVIVDRGPGSYVGLRVAVTFARFLAAFAAAELRVVDSLAVVAVAVAAHSHENASTSPTARWCPAIDGRQSRVQIGAWRRAGDELVAAAPAILLADTALGGFVRPGDRLVVPATLRSRLASVLAQPACTGVVAVPMPALHADALFAPLLPRPVIAPAALEPCYLAGSYVD